MVQSHVDACGENLGFRNRLQRAFLELHHLVEVVAELIAAVGEEFSIRVTELEVAEQPLSTTVTVIGLSAVVKVELVEIPKSPFDQIYVAVAPAFVAVKTTSGVPAQYSRAEPDVVMDAVGDMRLGCG